MALCFDQTDGSVFNVCSCWFELRRRSNWEDLERARQASLTEIPSGPVKQNCPQWVIWIFFGFKAYWSEFGFLLLSFWLCVWSRISSISLLKCPAKKRHKKMWRSFMIHNKPIESSFSRDYKAHSVSKPSRTHRMEFAAMNQLIRSRRTMDRI